MPMLKTVESGLGDPSKGYGARAIADYLNEGRTPTDAIADYLRNPKAGDAPHERVRAFASRNLCGAGPHEGRQAFPLTQNRQAKKTGGHRKQKTNQKDRRGKEQLYGKNWKTQKSNIVNACPCTRGVSGNSVRDRFDGGGCVGDRTVSRL